MSEDTETPEVKDLMVKDVIFSKRTNWKSEQEYRFMFSESCGQVSFKLDMQTNKFNTIAKYQSDKNYTDVPISKDSVKSIIFGARTGADEIGKIVRLVYENEFNCELYKMKMENGSLVKEPLINEVV